MEKVNIMVVFHKLAEMPADSSLYLPVLVGAKKNVRPEISYVRDDEGQNISAKNPEYCELTAIYWAWKNLQSCDAIGLVHYRRFFFEPGKAKTLDNVVTSETINALIKENGLILPRKRHYYIETNYSHYIHAHHQEPIDRVKNIIEKYYPEYAVSFDKIMNRRSAHIFNMFVMRRDLFDSYCSFIFGTLGHLEGKVDTTDYSAQEMRYFGYLAELLMDVWMDTNRVPYHELPWGQLGGEPLLKKGWHLVMRKVGLDRSGQTHF